MLPSSLWPATLTLMLNPTPAAQLVDSQGRPYFLWDNDMTLADFVALLGDPDLSLRGYAFGKLMRQAKPDDVLTLVTPQQIIDLWPSLARYLGQSREFWLWLINAWRRLGFVHG